MAHQLNCPCGAMIIDRDDTFVATVQAHLASEHPGREYGENEIMMLALPVPDRIVERSG